MKSDTSKILQQIDSRKEELFKLLMTLTRFRTPNPPGGNERPAQEWMAEQMKKLGFKTAIFDAKPGRPNAVGKLAGAGGGKSVILNGHIDVCEDQLIEKWKRNPYDPYIEGGKLFGRGVADMKGALASFLFVIDCIQRAGFKLKGDVTIESVIGEETGEPGTKSCLDKGYRADFAIVGEPTFGGKGTYPAVGILNGRLAIECPYTLHLQERRLFRQAGGGLEGANCIEKMASVIMPALDDLERHWAVVKKHPLIPPGHAMINVFHISGGGNTFIIPNQSTIDFTAYYLPGETKEAVQKEVEDKVRRAAEADFWLRKYPPKIEWEPKPDEYQFFPFDLDLKQPGVSLLMEAYKEVTGIELTVGGRGGIVDTGWFVRAGIPAITYGPGEGVMAHRIDEYVELGALVNYCKTLAVFLSEWCGVG